MRRAWKRTTRGRKNASNRARFAFNQEERLYDLMDRLNDGRFEPSPLRTKEIYYPKSRVAQVPSLEDKIVQHAICDNHVYNMLTKPCIRETAACMIGRGDRYASEILAEQLRRFWRKYHKSPVVLKCDIHNYFASIPHGRIKELVERYVSDETAREIMYKFIDMTEIGLPLGMQQSQLLANLYLSEMDHKIKERLGAEFYGRYMDDFYILSDDREYLEDCIGWIREYVGGIGLELNPKTGIHYGKIDFLGFAYHLTDTGKVVKRLLKSKRKTERNLLRKKVGQLAAGEITADAMAKSYESWRAHALQGDTHAFVKATDVWLNALLAPHGWQLIVTGKHNRRIKITKCQEH